jgi:hypothetical protein
MSRKQPVIDSDSLPVMVPRNDKPFAPVAPERVRRLREHLIGILKDLRKAKHPERFAAPLRPAPTGFAALVARSACSLCKGWCCRNGDDDAFLDDRTIARMRLAKPDATETALLRLYLSRVLFIRTLASSMANTDAHSTAQCAPMCAIPTTAAGSAPS